jgi:fatty-acyl-CoA synthase
VADRRRVPGGDGSPHVHHDAFFLSVVSFGNGNDGNEVAEGEVGEIYSCTPYAFPGYWKLPDKTAAAFRGTYCTVGDMARRDEDGYYYLADRKSNMNISGGENVYPSEVENLVGSHAK